MLVACLIVLVIGNIVIAEAKDDLNNNGYKLMPERNNGQEVKACGFPATDMIHLLQATGNFEHEFLLQLLEPTTSAGTFW